MTKKTTVYDNRDSTSLLQLFHKWVRRMVDAEQAIAEIDDKIGEMQRRIERLEGRDRHHD